MKIKDTRSENDKWHDYKILRSAQRIVEDLKIDTLFGDSKENFLYATLSKGLGIMMRQMHSELRRNEE